MRHKLLLLPLSYTLMTITNDPATGVESLEDHQPPELTADEANRQLEVEVASLRRELAEVRRDLAAKVWRVCGCVSL